MHVFDIIIHARRGFEWQEQDARVNSSARWTLTDYPILAQPREIRREYVSKYTTTLRRYLGGLNSKVVIEIDVDGAGGY